MSNARPVFDFVSRILEKVGLPPTIQPEELDSTIDVDGHILPKDASRVIREGEQFKKLIESPAWKTLLDRLESDCNIRLSQLKDAKHSDPTTVKSLLNRWIDGEDWLHTVQKIPLDAITALESIKSELGEDMNKVEEALETARETEMIQEVLDRERAERSQSQKMTDVNNFRSHMKRAAMVGGESVRNKVVRPVTAQVSEFDWDQNDDNEGNEGEGER